jgi:hypothetical protein
MNSSLANWFCENFKRYGGWEGELPVDKQELISLINPRSVYVASGQMDIQADL